MVDVETKRLVRLVAIQTLLQTKQLLTAPELASRFAVSVRTIYRDIKTLESAGVPILTAVDSLQYARSYDMAGKFIADEQETVNVAYTLPTTADDYARFIVAAMMKPGAGHKRQKRY